MHTEAGIDSDGAVAQIDSVATKPSQQRQKSGGCVTKDAGLAVIVPIEILIASPQQRVR